MRKREGKKPFPIHITEELCRTCNPLDPSGCVEAVAIRLADPNVKYAEAYATVAFLHYANGDIVRYINPPVLRKAQGEYDGGLGFNVLPGLYFLLPPGPKQTATYERKRSRVRRKLGEETKIKGKKYLPTGSHKPQRLNARRSFVNDSLRKRLDS